MIGKDIVRFHAVYWPAFLMSAGIAVPKRIFSHGFLFNRGEKMSKSVGNVIDPFTLADAYGVDQFRYFFLREVPFGQDGNYSHEAIVNRINADLANDLGNLAQRSLSMIGKSFRRHIAEAGRVQRYRQDHPCRRRRHDRHGARAHEDAATAPGAQLRLGGGGRCQPLFCGEAPWALAKTDPERQGTVLYVTAEVLRQVGILAQPFMPASAAKLLDLLAVPAAEREFSALTAERRVKAGRHAAATGAGFPALRRGRRRRPDHAGRQPLPSRFSGLCGRTRRRGRACPRGRHRPHGDDLDAGQTARAGPGDRRAISGRLLLGRHASAPRARRARHRRRGAHRRSPSIPRSWRSARRGSTITTTTARARRRQQGFRKHIAAARETGLPLVIHSRDADADMAQILEEESGKGAFPAVLHCFTGGRDLAFTAIALGPLRLVHGHPDVQEFRRAARDRR